MSPLGLVNNSIREEMRFLGLQPSSVEVPTQVRRRRTIVNAITIAITVVVLVSVDYLYALSVVMPVLFAGVALLFAVLLVTRRRQSRLRRICLVTLVVAIAIVIRLINWTPTKPFLKDLYSLRTGMTEADVERVMGTYARGTGWPASLGGGGELRVPNTIVFRPTSAPGDANWGVVKFENGRVIQIDFSPD